MSPIDSIHEIAFPVPAGAARITGPSEIEREIMELFRIFRHPLLRYALSFGISVHDAEEIIQDVFVALFQHLCLGRSRRNLRGWIFRVAHNLALKQRCEDRKLQDRMETCETITDEAPDPAPTPEEHLSLAQRQRRLLAVVRALPETDQSCLRLRAEGLRYREIAAVLGVSVGTVSMSLTRSLERLVRADGR